MEDASDGFERGWNQQSPSQNSVLPESTEKGTMTGKEVVKMLGIKDLKRYFSSSTWL